MNYRYRGGSGDVEFITENGTLEDFQVVAGAIPVTFQIGGDSPPVTLPAGFNFRTNKFCGTVMCCPWRIIITGDPLFWFVSWCLGKGRFP